MPYQGLSDGEITEQVRRLVSQGRIQWLPHALSQMADRGIAKDQVKECLQVGYYEEPPTVPNRGGAIEYKFRMAAKVDGDQLQVVASLVPDSKVIVITAFVLN